MKKKRVLQTLITTGSYVDFVEEVFHLAASKYSSYVCFSNVHMLIEAYKDPMFNEIVSEADMATPDGVPLRIAMRLLYGIRQDRIAGMDAFPHLLKEAAKRDKSVYFYGGKQEVLDAIVKRAAVEIPGLKIAGYYSPPFRKLSEEEKQQIRDTINDSHADLTFVALGCPKQEKWVASEQDKIKGCLLAVGGAFTVYAGMQVRAPKWMQKYSLEWLFRLVQEPKRLWKRYFVTNSLFIYLFIKELFLGKRNYSQITQKA
ncbi:MAG: WecB/TagA/CpsF family glycosyltransferase [Bacteroidota bacterium]